MDQLRVAFREVTEETWMFSSFAVLEALKNIELKIRNQYDIFIFKTYPITIDAFGLFPKSVPIFTSIW